MPLNPKLRTLHNVDGSIAVGVEVRNGVIISFSYDDDSKTSGKLQITSDYPFFCLGVNVTEKEVGVGKLSDLKTALRILGSTDRKPMINT